MHNTFIFRAVGQGLFYTGSLLNYSYNFVYDCGVIGNSKFLNNEIDNFIQEIKTNEYKPIIDFVVLSHLHKDHYSGLYKLCQKAKIKTLYIPYVGYSKKAFEFKLYIEIFNGHDHKGIDNSQLYNFMKSILQIDDNANNKYEFDLPERIVKLKKDTTTDYRPTFKDIYWYFHLILKKYDSNKINEINDKVNTLFKNNNCSNVIEYIKKGNDFKSLQNIYKNNFNNVNETSILLLHHPNCLSHVYRGEVKNYLKKLKNHQIICWPYPNYFGFKCKYSLLTGDTSFDNNIKSKIKKLVKKDIISVLQVPHHGSGKSWKSFINNYIDASIFVIPFGYNHGYRHPNNIVLNDLLMKGKLFFFATQFERFAY